MGSSQSSPLSDKHHLASATSSTTTTENNKSSNSNSSNNNGNEYYDKIDQLAAELPHVIDEESRIQVEDYKQACNNGKGPMVACFATAEFISLYERKHVEAAELYRNVCYRSKDDKSPNGVLLNDNTKAYPAGCYNLAKMLITGKGGMEVNKVEAYQLLDRACSTKQHGGACYLLAQILTTPKDSFAPSGIPHNPNKAMELYQFNCDDGDTISCYTLATMLLRGNIVTKNADNVSPQEAQGIVPVAIRENEKNRIAEIDKEHARDYIIHRDPKRAEELLKYSCDVGSHVTSCHNLAVMYIHGDDNVPPNPELAELYKKKTQEKIHLFGGF